MDLYYCVFCEKWFDSTEIVPSTDCDINNEKEKIIDQYLIINE
jgi:hypothetical protein